MYTPKHFEAADSAICVQLMREYPLAALVIQRTDGLVANHIPLVFERTAAERGVLKGHIARANPLWKEANDSDALAIFQGPAGYISPNWYPSKAVDGKVVPTWNYAVVHVSGRLRFIEDAVVHVSGRLRFIEDAAWKLDFLNRLTDEHEKHQPKPWSVTDAPQNHIEKLLGAIVGLELEIRSIKGKWKMSQNKLPEEQQGILKGLEQGQTPQALLLAETMRSSLEQNRLA